jgi:hypothetical protein
MKKSTNPVAAAAENGVHERVLGAAFQAFTEDGYAGNSTARYRNPRQSLET